MVLLPDFAEVSSSPNHIPDIKPCFDGMHSSFFKDHLEGLHQALVQIISEKNISIDRIEDHLPLIEWSVVPQSQNVVSFTFLTLAVRNYDLGQFFSKMISDWLAPGRYTEIITSKNLKFTFSNLSKGPFFLSHIVAVTKENILFEKDIKSLVKEMALGAVSPQYARHILVTKAITREEKTTLIHQSIVAISKRVPKFAEQDIFLEMHHFLLACDGEFKRIRNVHHICRIILNHNWHRTSILNENNVVKNQERKILVKMVKTPLEFYFSKKNVLGIIISISFLREYEQFDAKHILTACRRFIHDVTQVPDSFFSYVTSSDEVCSFYLEIEKTTGKEITHEEIRALRNGLQQELALSIEQLSQKLFMPYNEEEVLRNILLLSKEIRYVRDLPQVIISFQGQSEDTLRFHITLIRVLQKQNTPQIEELFRHAKELFNFIPGIKRVIGFIRNKYPKEANTFILECKKQPFMRQDHSIDLSRAREFTAATLQQLLGNIRDFNGGLIGQHGLALTATKQLLTPHEQQYEIYLENFFYTLYPTLMRCILSPEIIKRFFKLFIQLYSISISDKSASNYLVDLQDGSLCAILRIPTNDFFEKFRKEIDSLGFQEHELASTSAAVSDVLYAGYIVISQNQERIHQLFLLIEQKYLELSEEKKSTQHVRISLPRPTSLLDPRIGTDGTSGIVIKMLYEGLMRLDQSGRPAPAIAERVIVSTDNKRYTFFLRESYWSNGSPVTAHDFEYTWKKLLDPTFSTLYTYLFNSIKNAKAIKEGKKHVSELGIVVKDDKILEVELEYPSPYFLELISHWIFSPLCKQVDMLHPGWSYYGGDTYVCNGPFKLARWKRDKEIEAVKNPYYWDASSVTLEKIDISVIEDPNQAFELYKQDHLDWIGEPLSEIPPRILKKDDFTEEIHLQPIAAIHWYACNVQVKPFISEKTRKALAISLDRKAIIRDVLHGRETPAYSILPPNMSKKGLFFKDNDLVTARRLFEEGLREQDLDPKAPIPFTITCFNKKIHTLIVLAVKKRWEEVFNVQITLEMLPWTQFIQKCTAHQFQMMGTTWYSWINDPEYTLEQLKNLDHEMNIPQWYNQNYNDYLEASRTVHNAEEREKLLHQAEAVVMQSMPVIPVCCYNFKYMKKSKLQDISLSQLGQIDFKWAKIVAN